MPTNYATKQAATKLQVSPNTLRNWSDQYSDYLSESARPGYQPERRFTEKDLTILGYIKQLRAEGMKEDGIKERLTETSFTDIEVLAPTIQQAPEGTNVIAPTTQPESQHSAPAPIVAQDYLISIERRFEALEQSRDKGDRLTQHGLSMFALGFCAAALFFLILVALAALYAR
jgi:DNA-binding transcriptional MerR regulator